MLERKQREADEQGQESDAEQWPGEWYGHGEGQEAEGISDPWAEESDDRDGPGMFGMN